MNSSMISRTWTLVFLAVLLAPGSNVHAQDAKAKVNFQQTYESSRIAVVGARGMTATGAKFEGKNVDESFRVSKKDSAPQGVAANDAEIKAMKAVIDVVVTLHGAGPAARKQAVQAVSDAIKKNVVRVPGKQFDFMDKNEDQQPASQATAFHAKGQGAIQATGRQKFQAKGADGKPDTFQLLYDVANPGRKSIPESQRTVGLIVHRDPVGILWDPGPRSLDFSLAGLDMRANTIGSDSNAVSFLDLSASFVNGTLDLDAPASNASPLFDLMIGVFSTEGDPGAVLADFEFFGDSITDSLGNGTLEDVSREILRQIGTARTDTLGEIFFGFEPDYRITLGVPGSGSQSVLFVDGSAATFAAAPEPASGLLLISGFALIGALRSGRRRHARTASG